MIQRDTIQTAKLVASIDQVSGGRFLFGIGGGWNQEEIESHGTVFATRMQKMREQMEAMKEIWTKSKAEYEGEIVKVPHDDDLAEAGAETVASDHSRRRVSMGGAARGALRRRLVSEREQRQSRGVHAEASGRWPPMPGATRIAAGDDRRGAGRCRQAQAASATWASVRVNFPLPPEGADQILPILDRWAKLKQQVQYAFAEPCAEAQGAMRPRLLRINRNFARFGRLIQDRGADVRVCL